jgi:hypothetical protein
MCTASGTTALVLDSSELSAILLAEVGFAVVNFVLLTGLTGFSFGKLMTGVRVVNRETGQRCGIPRALLRTILLAIPDLGGIVGFIVAASSNEHRRVGDMAANTLVVHKRALGQPPVQPLYSPAMYTPGGYTVTPQTPPAGYSYPAPRPTSAWTPAPPAPAHTPVPHAPSSWPDFASPPVTDPDATTVFDTNKTDEHVAVGEPAKAAESKGEWTVPPRPGDKTGAPIPGVGAPHWDVKRNTYIQWDPELDAWMQWDLAKNEWQAMK